MSVEIAQAVFGALEMGDYESAAASVADNFTFSGPVPEPIGKDEWIGVQQLMKAAFPDWKFNAHMHDHGDTVHATVQISGTHQGDLDLSALGLPTVPATGTVLQMPQEEITITFDGDMMTSLSGEPVEGGGVMGILSQLGVELPPM